MLRRKICILKEPEIKDDFKEFCWRVVNEGDRGCSLQEQWEVLRKALFKAAYSLWLEKRPRWI